MTIPAAETSEMPAGGIPPPKKYMNAEEASTFIGVAVQTLAKWRCVGGAGPTFIKIGNRRVMYAIDDLNAWMNARRVNSTSEVSAVTGRSHSATATVSCLAAVEKLSPTKGHQACLSETDCSHT
jgi:hypothetical protein